MDDIRDFVAMGLPFNSEHVTFYTFLRVSRVSHLASLMRKRNSIDYNTEKNISGDMDDIVNERH